MFGKQSKQRERGVSVPGLQSLSHSSVHCQPQLQEKWAKKCGPCLPGAHHWWRRPRHRNKLNIRRLENYGREMQIMGGEGACFPGRMTFGQSLEGSEGGGEGAAVSGGREAQAVGTACAKAPEAGRVLSVFEKQQEPVKEQGGLRGKGW